MRFVAGWGAATEILAGSAMAKRMTALWQRTIGKRKIVKSRSEIMKRRHNSAD